MSPWFPFKQRTGDVSLRLFCLPYSGRGASIYSNWGKRIPRDIDVCPVQLPGRETRLREQAHKDMATLVPLLVSALLPRLDRPFAIFGHSMGALLGFELVRGLRRAGLPEPERLLVSGSPAPQAPHTKDRGTLSDDDLIGELRRMGGTPEQLLRDQELLQLFLPTLRADLNLFDTYEYKEEEPLACPIAVFGGAEDEEVGAEELSAWQLETQGDFSSQAFRGDHFFLHTDENAVIDAVARELSGATGGDRIRRSGTGS
jgi:surfactin synthase thioesterase subunit